LSKIGKSLDAGKAEKLVKIYQLCRAQGDNHSNLLKLFVFFSFFQVLQISLLFVLLDKKMIVCCTSVLLILFFAS